MLLLKSVPLNTSRFGSFYLPILALAAFGFNYLLERLPSRDACLAAYAILAFVVLAPMARFTHEYYGHRYAQAIPGDFNPNMPAALASAHRLAGSNLPIYMSEWIRLNYVDVLFYDKVDPVLFQHSGATWKNPDIGQYHFLFSDVATLPHPFVYLIPVPDYYALCSRPHDVQTLGELQVGICP